MGTPATARVRPPRKGPIMRQCMSGNGPVSCATRTAAGSKAAAMADALKRSFETENLDMMTYCSFQDHCTTQRPL